VIPSWTPARSVCAYLSKGVCAVGLFVVAASGIRNGGEECEPIERREILKFLLKFKSPKTRTCRVPVLTFHVRQLRSDLPIAHSENVHAA
jgi:hypothetical protein